MVASSWKKIYLLDSSIVAMGGVATRPTILPTEPLEV